MDCVATVGASTLVRRIVATFLLAVTVYLTVSLPYARESVGLIATLVAFTVYQLPRLAFVWVGIAIPAYDLTPNTGRFYFNEFDIWLLPAIAPALWSARSSSLNLIKRIDALLLGLLLISSLISMGVTLWESALDTEPTWNAYDNALNAIRITKPVMYASLLLWVLYGHDTSVRKASFYFAVGTAIGLLATTIAVAIERCQFGGFFDISSMMRPTGPFADMHVGGAYLDAYLVGALPLLLILWSSTKSS